MSRPQEDRNRAEGAWVGVGGGPEGCREAWAGGRCSWQAWAQRTYLIPRALGAQVPPRCFRICVTSFCRLGFVP